MVWPTRPIRIYPQQYVQTFDNDHIEVTFVGEDGQYARSSVISRHDARMLARRLSQCLDATK